MRVDRAAAIWESAADRAQRILWRNPAHPRRAYLEGVIRAYARWMLLALAFLVGCCATPATPYTVEHPLVPFSASSWGGWLADGPGKVLTVRNPLPYEIEATVTCLSGAQADGPPRWVVRVPARGEIRGLAQVENRDQGTNVCSVESWGRVAP